MHPDPLFWGITLYDIFILVGVVAAFLLADSMTVKRGFSVSLQRIVIVCALACVVVGYGAAVLFQAFYNFMETGNFEIANDTGATFYGGLIGGAIAFLLIYFIAGKHFCKNNEAVKRFPDMLDIGAACVPLAHAFGRLGCLSAGCCHGRETDAWYGIKMWVEIGGSYGYKKVVPIQLFESIFLFILAAVLIVLFFKNTGKHKIPLMPVYCVGYGIWRFIIEFFRADDRGETIVPFLTPSQLIALLLVVVGVGYFVLWYFKWRKKEAPALAVGEDAEENESENADGQAPASQSENEEKDRDNDDEKVQPPSDKKDE